LHPLIGFAASFINVFWQIFYWGVSAVFAADLGLAPLFTALGIQTGNDTLASIGSFFGSPMGWFVWGTFVILFVGAFMYRGISHYFRMQRWGMFIGMAMFLVFIIVLGLGASGVLDFRSSFNAYAGAGAVQQVIDQAEASGIKTKPPFSWGGTTAFVIWPAFSFLFAVLSVSFSGEIKNVERGQLYGITAANLISGALILLVTIFARGAFTDKFLIASGYLGVVEPEAFPLPYVWTPLLASFLSGSPLLTTIIVGSVALLISVGAGTTAVYTTRSILAWAIDGMAPEALARVHDRYHTPTVALFVVAILSMIHLVLYCFTDVYVALSGLAPMAAVFALVPFAGMIFPFLHRKTYEMSPARITVAGIPLITITGLIGFLATGFIVYRSIVDENYGVNTPESLNLFLVVIVVSVVWYFFARWYRRRQGVQMEERFKEIPIE
jgi:amino acid transporter